MLYNEEYLISLLFFINEYYRAFINMMFKDAKVLIKVA